MAKQKGRIIPFILTVFIIGILVAAGYLLYKDTTAPSIVINPDKGFITYTTPITITVNDVQSGVKAVKVVLTQGDKTTTLTELALPKNTFDYTQEILIGKKQIKQGNFEIAAWAVDASLAGFGSGNAVIARGNYTLDTVAPIITVQTSTHNLTQGGCGLVIYSLDGEPETTGVEVGEDFFPGYKQPNGEYASLFAMPFYTDVKNFNPVIMAQDTAKNKKTSTFWFHANGKKYRHDDINISDRFLNSKMPQFEANFPGTTDPMELFLRVNRELRKTNRAELRKIGLDTAPTFLFTDKFLRLPNAASKAGFGDQRTYKHNGKKIDNQTHLGVDLASTRHAPVPSANKGRVIIAAQDFGIYGNAVIIDHGLGLQTLYSHLSQIDVEIGSMVAKGQIIGKTGATGMAGGDHLHYGVLCSGVPVNPLEWWDDTWIKHNITGKLVNE